MPVETTRLLTQGQIVIPETFRQAHHWQVGQEFLIINTEEGVLLKPKPFFPPSRLDEVAGCLRYAGSAKTLADMEQAIAEGVKTQYGCS